MIKINIPGRPVHELERLVLDLNGTITLDGKLIEGVQERIHELGKLLDISIITADTLGKAQILSKELGVDLHKIDARHESIQKRKFIQQLGSKKTVAIGNGTNDSLMLKEAFLGICVVGAECAALEAINNAAHSAPHINAALDLLIVPERLIASLRR